VGSPRFARITRKRRGRRSNLQGLSGAINRPLQFEYLQQVTSGNLRPEGAGGSGQGFNPGNRQPERPALKGRQIERPNKVE
jgi:hypothetical protein